MSEKKKFLEGIFFPFFFICVLWAIKLYEYESNYDLSFLGVYPRSWVTLPCIFTAPLIHGNFFHLISNTLPLLILGITVFYFYHKIAFEVFFWIYFLSGLWVWVSAFDDAYHIGASGLVYGFVSFLFFSGLFRKDKRALMLSIIVAFVYGGMFWGIFPFYEGISWEYHFFGALSGGFCAFYYRNESAGHVEEVIETHEEEGIKGL